MTALHFHRARTPLPVWQPVTTATEVHFAPELHTAAELMADRPSVERLTDASAADDEQREMPVAS